MKRICLTIQYDGSGFYGWQKQEGFRTVQGEVEKALSIVLDGECEVFASGRTDAGVHALGQTAHFDMALPIPVSRLADVLNSLLPEDIAIKKAVEVDSDFHARFSIKRKCYEYRVYTGKTKRCLSSRYEGWVKNPLDVDKMIRAAKMFVGTHNFQGYCSSSATVSDYTRTIYDIRITKKKDMLSFEVEGSGFLYNMVRILVGTLIDIGRGKLTEKSAKEALEKQDRSKAGVTMPPNGLYLKWTKY